MKFTYIEEKKAIRNTWKSDSPEGGIRFLKSDKKESFCKRQA